MSRGFDPVAIRDFWLRDQLQYVLNQDPSSWSGRARYGMAEMQVARIVKGWFAGMSKESKPALQKLATWMENQPEPTLADFVAMGFGAEAWRDNLYEWRQVLGLSKWLAWGDAACDDFTAASAAGWQMLELASPELLPRARVSRRTYMGIHLVTALAADAPLIGLKIYEASGLKPTMGHGNSPLSFGYWACRHLVDGGTRDATFIERGRKMLTANLLPTFDRDGDLYQGALWLKAIYFDSGAVQTPEQAIAKGYDSMPGVARPDFILD